MHAPQYAFVQTASSELGERNGVIHKIGSNFQNCRSPLVVPLLHHFQKHNCAFFVLFAACRKFSLSFSQSVIMEVSILEPRSVPDFARKYLTPNSSKSLWSHYPPPTANSGNNILFPFSTLTLSHPHCSCQSKLYKKRLFHLKMTGAPKVVQTFKAFHIQWISSLHGHRFAPRTKTSSNETRDAWMPVIG